MAFRIESASKSVVARSAAQRCVSMRATIIGTPHTTSRFALVAAFSPFLGAPLRPLNRPSAPPGHFLPRALSPRALSPPGTFSPGPLRPPGTFSPSPLRPLRPPAREFFRPRVGPGSMDAFVRTTPNTSEPSALPVPLRALSLRLCLRCSCTLFRVCSASLPEAPLTHACRCHDRPDACRVTCCVNSLALLTMISTISSRWLATHRCRGLTRACQISGCSQCRPGCTGSMVFTETVCKPCAPRTPCTRPPNLHPTRKSRPCD